MICAEQSNDALSLLGRLLGKVETEVKWQAKEAGRKALVLFKEADLVKKQRREQD
jgi:hypothetical protein